MTENDPGHMNSLDRTQAKALQQCWISLINAISDETSLSVEKIADSTYGDELFCAIGYDNPDTLVLRWLRAKKWNVDDAVEQLMSTLKWRHEWGVNELVAEGENELIEKEISTGKTYLMGHDKAGRPITYVHVKNHIKGQFSDENTQLLAVMAIETCRKSLESPIETATVVIDMSGFSMKNMDYQVVKFFINLLENHYPESLGLALIINVPLLFYSCWSVIKHWLDPVVQSKIHFLKNQSELTKFIDPSAIPKRLNGTQPDFKYIPPTDEDKAMLSAFRNDEHGEEIVRAAHRKAARNYLNITLQWAQGDDNQTLLADRRKAAKKLRNAFKQLVPYVTTRTHYHRQGLINEPIFGTVYEQILLRRNEEKFAQF